MRFSEFIDYLQLEKNYTVHTVKAYGDDLSKFAAFIEENFADTSLENVNYGMIRSWIVELVDSGLTNRSINRKISSLQAYYNFLLRTKQIEASPLLKHKSLKTARKVQVPFSQNEMKKAKEKPVGNTFKEKRDKLIVELLYSTGMRRSELITLKTADVHPDRKTLKIYGKGGKERLIPLLPSVLETARDYLDQRKKLERIEDVDYLLLTEKGNKLYEMLVYRVVTTYFSDISTKQKTGPHILRHSFATHLLNEGADIKAIKELLGHASLSSTQVYTHNDIASLRKIHAGAHPRNKPSEKKPE